MKRLCFYFSVLCLLLAQPSVLEATETFVGFDGGDWMLNEGGSVRIYVSEDEERGVALAVDNLGRDLARVCHAQIELTSRRADADIVIGTIGHLGDYAPQLKGRREMFLINARSGQLVIAGSDRRGAIYGVYELSRQIGVSPWYDWADVPVRQHAHLYIKNGCYTDGEPAVAWRGIFLNDEAPCLTSWVARTYGTEYGGHEFYSRVFELILRLKGNMLWPAMWSWAFYADDPLNSKTADEMGIIIGTSHHEPMARNHQEYARERGAWGPWNYQTNKKRLDRFFREGIERIRGTDDIVTIGMRGDGDEAMSAEADTRLLERIVGSQRRIIRQATGRPASATPQVWALYKEVLDYYDQGMRVPDDVCMLLSDDNWGNIRRVPNARERQHKGGWGIYYHVDYVGAPRNSKWLCATQTQQMFEQLSLAYDFGIDRMWILNVGDLKPMEYTIQLFLDMAWSPKTYTQQSIAGHTRSFFSAVFADAIGERLADEAADIYNTHCKYAARVTAEMLDAKTYDVASGEWRRVADDYQRLELRALRLCQHLPDSLRDCYRELLLFPVQAMANLYDMYYAQAMNHYLAECGNPDANLWAERVGECFRRDSLLCQAYNEELAGGKWNGMMTQKHIGYTSWNDNFPHETMPPTKRVPTADGGFTFRHSDGYVAMEAEHYFKALDGGAVRWAVYPDYGRTRSGVALTPYTEPTGDAELTYRFLLPEHHPDRVKIYVVVKSTLDFENRGGHEFTVSLDCTEPQVVNFNKTLVDRQPYTYTDFYPAVARRVVVSTVEQMAAPGPVHELRLHPRHPGIVFEKIVVDYGGYRPQYLFGEESEVVR